jgi:uncharacterized OB-fold protein
MVGELASGCGEVRTYTVVHHTYDAALADRLPYVLAAVRLDEGPIVPTDIVRCNPAGVHVGMRVQGLFEAIDADTGIPRFTPQATKEAP